MGWRTAFAPGAEINSDYVITMSSNMINTAIISEIIDLGIVLLFYY
jgi:hypothetical protein